MAKIELAQFRGDNLFGGIGRGGVREMTVPAEDPLFDAPRAAEIFLQQFQIMICFQHEHIGGAHALDDELRGMAEVSKKPNSPSAGVQKKSHRVVGVVWHAE